MVLGAEMLAEDGADRDRRAHRTRSELAPSISPSSVFGERPARADPDRSKRLGARSVALDVERIAGRAMRVARCRRDRLDDLVRLLPGDQAAGDLGAGGGRNDGLGARSLIAAEDAVEFQRRLAAIAASAAGRRSPSDRASARRSLGNRRPRRRAAASIAARIAGSGGIDLVVKTRHRDPCLRVVQRSRAAWRARASDLARCRHGGRNAGPCRRRSRSRRARRGRGWRPSSRAVGRHIAPSAETTRSQARRSR